MFDVDAEIKKSEARGEAKVQRKVANNVAQLIRDKGEAIKFIASTLEIDMSDAEQLYGEAVTK